jgi:hypothetical protein
VRALSPAHSSPHTEVRGANEALRLLNNAEQIAERLGREAEKYVEQAELLTSVAAALARINPVRAEAIARGIRFEDKKAEALSSVAEAIVGTDPGEAARLLADSQHYFKLYVTDTKIRKISWLVDAQVSLFQRKLTRVTQAVARTDPAAAAQLLVDAQHTLAQYKLKVSLYPGLPEWALTVLAEGAAGVSADVAKRIADDLPSQKEQAEALSLVVSALAKTDLNLSTQIARSLVPVPGGVPESGSPPESDKASAASAAFALVSVAEATAQTDRGHAEELLAEAEQMARDAGWQPLQLVVMAALLAKQGKKECGSAFEPLVAEAHLLARRTCNGYALLRVAEATAQAEPGHAAELLAEAEQMAAECAWAEESLIAVAVTAAGIDPGRAEHIAHRFVGGKGDDVFGRVAAELALTDPDRAERLARSITGEDKRDEALGRVAAELVRTDPARAERITRSITSHKWRGEVAVAIAGVNPGQAEEIARGITSHGKQAEVLARVAVTVANTDSAHAMSLLAEAEQMARALQEWPPLEEVAVAASSIDPAGAERMARSAGRISQTATLGRVVKAITRTDPARAEKIARSKAKSGATDDFNLGKQLVSIAESWLDSGTPMFL